MKKLFFLISIIFSFSTVSGQPNEINIQGLLKDSNGNKLNGSFSMTFNFYETSDAQNPVYGFTPSSKVDVVNGIFNVTVDLGTQEIFKTHPELWLGVIVENEPEFPRIKIVSSGYALHAKYADTLLNPASDISCSGCVGTDDISDGSVSGVKIAADSVDSSKIVDGSITFADIGANGCSAGQIMKFDGNNWICSDDTGGVAGGGTAGYIPQFTDTSSLGNSLIYQKNGNLGIGTEDPSAKIDIALDSNEFLSLTGECGYTHIGRVPWAVKTEATCGDGIYTSPNLHLSTPGFITMLHNEYFILYKGTPGSTTTQLEIDPANKIRFYIPAYFESSVNFKNQVNFSKLQVSNSSNDKDLLLLDETTGGEGNTVAIAFRTNGDPQSMMGRIKVYDRGAHDADMIFELSDDGQNNTVTNEKMRITKEGNVGIGTSTPKAKLEVTGGIKVGNTTLVCNAETEGTIRYNKTEKNLEFCNGTAWVAVGTGGSTETGDGTSQAKASYSCYDILINYPDSQSGIYWIDPDGGSHANAFQVYCDMTTDGGGWTMIYKKSDGVVSSPYNDYKSGSLNEGDTNLLNKDKSTKDYSNRIITMYWNKFTEARVEIIKNGSVVKYMKYTLVGTNNENWYSKSHLKSSSWTDIVSQSQNYWSITGDTGCTGSGYRDFFINHNYGGCPSDAGWIVVDGNYSGCGCSWEQKNRIKYSKLQTYANWNTSNTEFADVFVIMVR